MQSSYCIGPVEFILKWFYEIKMKDFTSNQEATGA